MKRTFKYRVYPTRPQERWLYAEFKHQKHLYNYMLQMRSQMYNYGSISVSRNDQINHLAKLRENSYYGDHPQDMQVSTIKRLDAAYDNFFGRCKDSKARKKGHPKFKCKSCGLKLDRDHNAAINILNRAETCALRGEVWDTILYETRNPLLKLACWS